ncbi:cytochrome P450 27C1, partial [Tachysurus ichikawai]
MALRDALFQISRKSVRNDACWRIALQIRTLYDSAVQEEPELKHAGLVKSLREMPGPSAIGNLIEFFYRDGFSRIHEIQ